MPSKPFSPPALFFSSILALEAAHILLPGPMVMAFPLTLLGVPLILGGVGLHSAATGEFRRQRTTLATLALPSTLVTSGLFRHTRNPMYLAGVLILTGCALYVGTLTPLLVAPLFGLLAQRWFILPEEELLEREFGEVYEAYKEGTCRWV